jgi:SNF2 family DNA or RNA helicase
MPDDGTVFAEISEDGKRVDVKFDYNPDDVRAAKRVPGYRFIRDSPGPLWRYPRDTTTMRMLRDEYGIRLKLGPKLIAWGRDAVQREDELKSMASADDAELTVVPKLAPKFYEWLRPYQRADAALMARTNLINACQPGLGKTAETIAAIMERGEDHFNGSHLIVAPKTSLDVVWEKELEQWTEHPIIVTSGDDSQEERRELLDLAQEFHEDGQPFFLVLNPAFVRYVKDKEAEPILVRGKRVQPMVPVYPELFGFEWNTVVFDEYHKMGLSNSKTNMFAAANDLKAEHKILLSGTPMGGKPIKLWGALHFLEPESFTSKWRWVDQWLDTSDNGYGKIIEGIRDGREDAFWEHLKPYMVRRTKAEVLKELPPKQYVDIWCEMTPKQAKQYEAMATDAELKIEEENLSATGILAEYMRLKQFAGSHQSVSKFADGTLKLYATGDSGKLPHLLRLLEERGITGEEDDKEGDEQVVIGSQFSGMVDMIHKYLEGKGIPCAKITGSVSQAHRTELVKQFQAGEVRVMVMTTTAGGVAITLDKASTVIIMDETWDPDDQEQLEDRVHRASRIHQVTIYYLRSKGTIEEYIKQVTMGKAVTNREVLDLRRQGLRAI